MLTIVILNVRQINSYFYNFSYNNLKKFKVLKKIEFSPSFACDGMEKDKDKSLLKVLAAEVNKTFQRIYTRSIYICI